MGIVGAFGGMFDVAAKAMIGDVSEPTDQGRGDAYAAYNLVNTVASFLGLFGGTLLLNQELTSYAMAYALNRVINILILIAAIMVLEETAQFRGPSKVPDTVDRSD